MRHLGQSDGHHAGWELPPDITKHDAYTLPCPLIINIHSFSIRRPAHEFNYIGGEIDRDVPLVHPGGAMAVYPDAPAFQVAGSCWNVPGGSN